MTDIPKLEDLDPVETQEWLESIDSVLKTHGPERAHYLLERLIDYTRRSGAYLPFKPNTAYVNSIPTGREPEYPGNRALERRIEAYIRWNAMAMVVQANRVSSEYGGHLSRRRDWPGRPLPSHSNECTPQCAAPARGSRDTRVHVQWEYC